MKSNLTRPTAVLAILAGILLLASMVFSSSSSNQPSPIRVVSVPANPRPTNLDYHQLVEQVAPSDGTSIKVKWGDMGQKLVEAGAIDMDKLMSLYGELDDEQLEIMQGDSSEEITFTPENIQFWTNVLWAFGLTQESKVLSAGPIKQREAEVPIGNYASTGGWTLGSKPATELYNSTRLIHLTAEQDALVYRVAENIYRPCCGNSTVYPDCNHGMAVLGLLELMVSQGATESDLYEAAFAFNSYAFMGSYVTLAAYFDQANVAWSDVDPSTVLGFEYSSGQAAQQIAARVGNIPGTPSQRGGCTT